MDFFLLHLIFNIFIESLKETIIFRGNEAIVQTKCNGSPRVMHAQVAERRSE